MAYAGWGCFLGAGIVACFAASYLPEMSDTAEQPTVEPQTAEAKPTVPDGDASLVPPAGWPAAWHVFWQASYWGVMRSESFAHAANFAYSILSSLFPFLILLTGLAGYWGGDELAKAATDGLLQILPHEIASILKPEVSTVLTGSQRQVLTIGAILLVVIVTGLVESLRMGLNYAYRASDTRFFLIRRLEGTFFMLVGGIVIMGLGFLVIFMPVVWRIAVPLVPELMPYWSTFNRLPLVFFSAAAFLFLLTAHYWLPAKRMTLRGVLPGVLITLSLWFVAGLAFSYYLSHFASYTKTYAGLAGAIAALLFFYICGLIFQFGAEVNNAWIDWREGKPGITWETSGLAG
ncbi:MAG: YihY/virulence factor BrkB family protein [Hyphomicrobiaceae bacterium]|nr:YihY/virulence factor BrkB family protein [Hyphomicrobiaceae bacterium]